MCCRSSWCHSEVCTEPDVVSDSASDNVLIDDNGTLTIRRADAINQGVYILRANNSFGTVVSPGITLRLAGCIGYVKRLHPLFELTLSFSVHDKLYSVITWFVDEDV